MKNFNRTMKLGWLIGCSLSAGAALAGSPNGQTYEIAVFRSNNSQFNSCFVFDKSGNLNVGGYGSIIYRHDQLNTQPDAWQAAPQAAHIPHGFILSFHGTVGGDTGQTIAANGMNDGGITYILQGVVVSSCPATATPQAATDPWKSE